MVKKHTFPVSSPQHILLIQTAFLGDLILTLPLINALLDVWPSATLSVLARPFATDLLQNYPRVQVLPDDKTALFWKTEWFAKLKDQSPQMAIIPHRSTRSTLVALASGAQVRVGFHNAGLPFLLSHRALWSKQKHEAERMLSLLHTLNVTTPPLSELSELRYLPFDENEMKKRWEQFSKPVLIFPSTQWASKNWTAEGYAEVTKNLASTGYQVLLLGTAEQYPLCHSIIEKAGSPSEVYNLAGETRINDLLYLIKSASLVISGDSAPAHIAGLFNKPQVVIYGPTSPLLGFTPLGRRHRIVQTELSCRPCNPHGPSACPLTHHRCMKEIAPDAVLEACYHFIRGIHV